MFMLKKVLLATALLSITLSVALGIYFYGLYRRVTVTNTNHTAENPPIDTRDRFEKQLPYSVVLLGYGGGGHEGGKLTDTILLAYVVPKEESIYLISIPRDLWVPLETTPGQQTFWKINAAYAIGSDDRSYPHKPVQYTGPAGGGEMAKDAIKLVTGIRPDQFVALDFAGFEKSIDALGGVDVTVDKTFDDFAYPIEEKIKDSCGLSDEELKNVATYSAELLAQALPCRYEHIHYDKGVTHMDGVTALKFVRSRHSVQDGSDFARSRRQKNVILAVKNKVISVNFFPKIIPFVTSLSNDLTTDIHLNDMDTFLKHKDEFIKYKIHNIAISDQNILGYGRSENGQSILVPKTGQGNWQSIQDFLKQSMASASAEIATGSGKTSQ
jgi:LCP family protein required for cell wall assembly